MSVSLNGKSAIITGAFGTLGAATARAAVRAGARIALLDRAATAPPGSRSSSAPDGSARTLGKGVSGRGSGRV